MTEICINTNINNPQYDYPNFHKYDNQIFVTSKSAQDTVEILQDKEENKRSRKLGMGIILASVVTAVAAFVLTKGLPKNTAKLLTDYISKIEEKINLRQLKHKNKVVTSMYLKTLKGLNKFLDRATSINNITSLKDILFDKFMSKTKVTKKICASITNLFERISKKTVNGKYQKLDKKFSNLFSKFSKIKSGKDLSEKVTINGVERTVEEWLKIVSEKQGTISAEYSEGFGIGARLKRYASMKKANRGLDAKVWETALNGMEKGQSIKSNVGCLKNSQVHQSFIAQDFLEQDKAILNDGVSKIRNVITHDIGDNYKASKILLNDIFKSLAVEDKEANRIVKSLRTNLSSYRKLKGADEQQLRHKLNETIRKDLQTLEKLFKENNTQFGYDEKTTKDVNSCITNIQNILNHGGGKGELQEILTIYKAILPKKDYNKIKKEVYSFIKNLDKAIDTENNKFFDKLRDLKLGSAPTDVLTLLSSIGGVGIGLANANNADERKSALLKYGIPAIGGIATSLALTVRLTAGFKSLALGFLSSIVMGKIGAKVDKQLKLKKEETANTLAQNPKSDIVTNNL